MKNIVRTCSESMGYDSHGGVFHWSWSFPDNYASKGWTRDCINSEYEEYEDRSLWVTSIYSYKKSLYF